MTEHSETPSTPTEKRPRRVIHHHPGILLHRARAEGRAYRRSHAQPQARRRSPEESNWELKAVTEAT